MVTKKTKVETHYRPAASKNCGLCEYMQDNGGCRKVQGQVDRKHVCDLFRRG